MSAEGIAALSSDSRVESIGPVIADATLSKPGDKPPSESELLGAQFQRERAELRPLYDRLVRAVKKLGPDVNVGVRKTQTTFARSHTFAIAKAPTRTRIDLGLRLPDAKPTKRLQSTTAFSDNATHCVILNGPADVDDQLKKWMRAAYVARGWQYGDKQICESPSNCMPTAPAAAWLDDALTEQRSGPRQEARRMRRFVRLPIAAHRGRL